MISNLPKTAEPSRPASLTQSTVAPAIAAFVSLVIFVVAVQSTPQSLPLITSSAFAVGAAVSFLLLSFATWRDRRIIRNYLEIIGDLGKKLEDVTDRYELLTSNLAASVIIRAINGHTAFCSPYTEVLTGYPSEHFLESEDDFYDTLVLPDDRERFLRAKSVSALGEEIVVRYQIRHKSGIHLWVETHLVPVYSSTSEIESVLAVSMDVTATVRHQQRIEEQNRDLNDFTYMISHDLKTPLFTIKGMASVLSEELGNSASAEVREALNHITQAATRLEALVSSVLEYSSLSMKEINSEPVDLQPVLHDAVQDLESLIREKNATITLPTTSIPSVQGDPLRLYQVFANLIGNALKYSDPARTPLITVQVDTSDQDSVTISVTDNGLGIPANKLSDIFRPYQRAHSRDIEGSGIGLASVKKIVDRLGGTVRVQSTEGQGSTFTVTLRREGIGNQRPSRD